MFIDKAILKHFGFKDPNESMVENDVTVNTTPSASPNAVMPADDDTLAQLAAAQKRAEAIRSNAQLGEGFSDIFSSIAGKKQDTSGFYNTMAKNAELEANDIASKSKLAGELNTQRRASALTDANSAPSKAFQATLKRLYGDKFTDEQLSKISAADKDIIMDPLKLEETVRSRQAMSNAMATQKEEARNERVSEKKRREEEQDVQKLSKNISDTQEMVSALDEVENQLGFKLDEADVSGGVLKVGGKEKDLPGVSLPLLGRTSFYSGDARRLESAVAAVFNAKLKDRSGSAVTNTELERLKTEFGSGKFNTEAEMVGAMQRYKRAVAAEMRNREAAFDKEIVNKYKEQGGRTSDSLAPKQTNETSQEDKVLVINPQGQRGRIPRHELESALAQGYKVVN